MSTSSPHNYAHTPSPTAAGEVGGDTGKEFYWGGGGGCNTERLVVQGGMGGCSAQ